MCLQFIKLWVTKRREEQLLEQEESEEVFDIVTCIEPHEPREFIILDMNDELIKRRFDLYYMLMHEDLTEDDFDSIIDEIEMIKQCEVLISDEREERCLF